MTFIANTHTLRVMMNGFDGKTKPTADRELEMMGGEGGVYKCKGEAWNILMSSNRYIRMSLVLQEISYSV